MILGESSRLEEPHDVDEALASFARRVEAAYGARLVDLILFGSRARGDAHAESDVDVAVVLDAIGNRAEERNRLSDIAYEVVAATAVDVQPWLLSAEEWRDPSRHGNPALVRAIRTDGKRIAGRLTAGVSRLTTEMHATGAQHA